MLKRSERAELSKVTKGGRKAWIETETERETEKVGGREGGERKVVAEEKRRRGEGERGTKTLSTFDA